MSRALYRLGGFAARRPWVVIGAWLLVLIVVLSAGAGFGRKLDVAGPVPGLESQEATDLLANARSDRAGVTAQVVVTPRDSITTFYDSSRAVRELARLQEAIAALPNVVGTSDPAGELASVRAKSADSGFVSPDGRIALIRVQYPLLEELSGRDLERLEELVFTAREGSLLQIEMSGELLSSFEEAQTSVGEMVGLGVAIVILFLAFGSLVAMGLPLGMTLFGLAIGIGSMSLITYLFRIPSFAPQMASMIGLAVGIDYALFLVARHREYLARGMTVQESVARAVATAGQAVIVAGATVVVAILGLAFSGVPFMTAAGLATSVIVLIMMVASVTLLPAFLGLAGEWINRLGFRRPGLETTRSPGWQRWGRHVTGHARAYAIGTTVFLLALSAPVLDLRLGTPDDGTLPETRTEKRAYDLVASGFGRGSNGPLVIAVDSSKDPRIVERLRAAIAVDSGIASVAPPESNPDARVTTIVALPATGPEDAATVKTIERLRTDVIAPLLEGSPARVYVGGATASLSDIGGRVSDRLPLFVAAVIALSFLLLTVMFRSLLVPLKAALLNLLSIGAAFGVLVMVFEWGWGSGMIGVESTLPVDPFIPLFMFAVLFGLSMDYEVFLLSRVREEFLRTGDNESSVIDGIAGSARVITSAALIMISVFLGFVLGADPVIKMVGLGLATAIFVDATIIRMILVPATMKLLGDANWWIPRWLDRLLPTIALEGDAGLPAPKMKTARVTSRRTSRSGWSEASPTHSGRPVPAKVEDQRVSTSLRRTP